MSDYCFILQEMNALRTYIPLIEKYNSLGARSSFILHNKNKYNSPHLHQEYLKKICSDYKINTIDFFYFQEHFKNKTIFTLEGKRIIDYDKEPVLDAEINQVHSLPSQLDFLFCYKFQKEKAIKNLFQTSRAICDYYKIQDEKLFFSGDPKYSINLEKEKVELKYKINTDKKIALLIHPEKPFGVSDENFLQICEYLKKLDFCVIVKARGKYSIKSNTNFINNVDYLFEDFSWFPHDTMELIHVADICINMDSTASMEMTMLNTPFINYRVADRPNVKAFAKTVGLTERVCNFIYHYRFCTDNNEFGDFKCFSNQVEYLTGENFSSEFEKAQKDYFFDKSKTLYKIISVVS